MVYKKYMVASTPFESSSDVYRWLSSFTNFEKRQTKRDFSLELMSVMAEMAGHPEKCAPSIHVAGSKGKGSVTGMIASILEKAGIKTALYASPHVSDFRERISAGNNFFDEETYTATGRKLKELVEKLLKNEEPSFEEPTEEPTFFELFTLWFFLCARHSACGAMAVETGMGGRLDATNILDPLVSVITGIELEHTEYLGKTIAAIAGEKAGIIKQNRPLVLAEQSGEALEVFLLNAGHRECPFFYFPECTTLKKIRVDERGTSFTLAMKYKMAAGERVKKEILPDLFVPIPGEVQAKNAGLAILTLKVAFPHIQNQAIYDGLKCFLLPARFERISDTPPVVIDGAHTARSVDLTVKTFTSLYGGGGILIFGCAAGKDIFSMAELCTPFFSRIIITTPGTFKESSPEKIYSAFDEQRQRMEKAPEIIFIPDTDEAIDRAVKMALEKKIPILGTGSFYLAAEIRKRLGFSKIPAFPVEALNSPAT